MPAYIEHDPNDIHGLRPDELPNRRRTCFNCESGKMQLGDHGRYCFDCDTYLPSILVDRLADQFFYELVLGDERRAEELKTQLEYYRQATIESVTNVGNQ